MLITGCLEFEDVVGELKVGRGNVKDVFYHVSLSTLRCVGVHPKWERHNYIVKLNF